MPPRAGFRTMVSYPHEAGPPRASLAHRGECPVRVARDHQAQSPYHPIRPPPWAVTTGPCLLVSASALNSIQGQHRQVACRTCLPKVSSAWPSCTATGVGGTLDGTGTWAYGSTNKGVDVKAVPRWIKESAQRRRCALSINLAFLYANEALTKRVYVARQ